MRDVSVYLIGGAPGVGKSTLACALAARLGISSVSIDDLLTVAQSVTTPESHPGLHVMKKRPYLEYFTNSSLDVLKADASLQHEAAWPLVECLIRKHTPLAPSPIVPIVPMVIEGWHLRPSKVAQFHGPRVWSGWLVASPAVLEERERRNVGWMHGSSNQSQMLANFLARSLWHNELIRDEATRHQMNVLFQDGTASVDDLCDRIVGSVDG